MALPLSLTQPFRQGQLTVGNGWRSFWAPFNQQLAVSQTSTVLGPTIYDLEVTNKFIDTATGAPAGWFDLGYVKEFKFTPASKVASISSGYRGAVRAKYRAEVAEKFTCMFAEVTHMSIAIATGCQVFNLLKSTAAASTTGPLSSSGIAAVALGASGYVASSALTNYSGQPALFVPSGSGAAFAAGSMIVCDIDYSNQFGYVGDAGANVFQGAVSDVDFIRKTSDYVNGVVAVVTAGSGGAPAGQDALVLTSTFTGGGNAAYGVTPTTAPSSAAGSKVQAITGYAAREGGTFLREWSAVFVMDTVDGSQFLFYYPRVAPDTFTGFNTANVPGSSDAIKSSDLNASFEAMAFDDPLDGETVIRYCAYVPHAGTSPAR
jgi:hypothetical protein